MKTVKLFVFSFLIVAIISCENKKEKLISKIEESEKRLFSDSANINMGKVNYPASWDIVKLYTEYSDNYPEDAKAPEYLFDAAKILQGINQPNEAIEYLQKIINNYNAYEKAPVALFLIAFIYETELNEFEKAKETYSEFLKKYPNSEYAPAANASFDQIESGKSNEELIKEFQEKENKSL